MQQMQEMPADGIVVGLEPDALAVAGVVVPVAQHRAERGEQPIRNVARSLDGVASASGSVHPSADTPVRSTSIGWLDAGNCSRTVNTAFGGTRNFLSLAL